MKFSVEMFNLEKKMSFSHSLHSIRKFNGCRLLTKV